MSECMREVPTSKGRCCCNCGYREVAIEGEDATIPPGKYICNKRIEKIIILGHNTRVLFPTRTSMDSDHGLCDHHKKKEK